MIRVNRNLQVDSTYFLLYLQTMEKLTKLSFGFTEDDMRILKKIVKSMSTTHGKTSYIAAIRTAIRTTPAQEKVR